MKSQLANSAPVQLSPSAGRKGGTGWQKCSLPFSARAEALRWCSWHSILFRQVPLPFFPHVRSGGGGDGCVSVHSWLTTSACAKQLSVSSADSEDDVRVTPALCSLMLGSGFSRASVVSSLQLDRDWTGDLKNGDFY